MSPARRTAGSTEIGIDGVRDDEHRVVNHLFHDFKGGLSTVLMCLEAIRDAGGEDLDPIQARWLETAERTCDRLVGLINNYRDLTQMIEGELPAEPEDVDLEALVGLQVAALEATARSRSQTVELTVQADLGRVRVSAGLLPRLLATLLPHLLDNTSSRGRLLLAIEASAGTLRLKVDLEGVESEQPLLDTVFDRVAQADHGLQLGRAYTLLYCRTAARYLGGDLRLTPWKGHGSTVELWLPCTDANPET